MSYVDYPALAYLSSNWITVMITGEYQKPGITADRRDHNQLDGKQD